MHSLSSAVRREEGRVVNITLQLLEELLDLFRSVVREELAASLQPDEWLDAAGAAGYLKSSKARIYNLSSESRIPVHHEGGRLLFSRRELEEWIKSGSAAG
jgi:hypothetical protein